MGSCVFGRGQLFAGRTVATPLHCGQRECWPEIPAGGELQKYGIIACYESIWRVDQRGSLLFLHTIERLAQPRLASPCSCVAASATRPRRLEPPLLNLRSLCRWWASS